MNGHANGSKTSAVTHRGFDALSIARSPFSLLTHLAGDDAQLQIFSRETTIESWLAAERALALAQGEHGVIDPADAAAIAAAARRDNIDESLLWDSARNVGYPVLGLVRQIAAALPPGPNGRVHYGATTQDIMDTALALQLQRSLGALDRVVGELGDAVAQKIEEHAHTVMAARTHAQQAVPTTYGATLVSLLAELTRHRERLAQAMQRVARVSLFGAGGTAAALGTLSHEVRASMARRLVLRDSDLPWHVARDGLAEYGWLCATLAATCARLARNVVDLSRTEIAEVFEPYESHRGASSTMPQKVNPISSELIIGAAGTAGALASALPRIQEAGHERAAGEWQIEWQVLPQLGVLAGTSLTQAAYVMDGLQVDADRMRANLGLDGGLVMAEAHMINLAQHIGREQAHDVIYAAARQARDEGRPLSSVLSDGGEGGGSKALVGQSPNPREYLGEAARMCENAVAAWGSVATSAEPNKSMAELANLTG